MKLKEVKHTEIFCGKEWVNSFSTNSNRFVLFDRNGNKLSTYWVSKIESFLDLEVLETTKSGYVSCTYGVGFPTTHIKLDFEDRSLLEHGNLKYGETEEDRGC